MVMIIMLGVCALVFGYALYLGLSGSSDGDKELERLKVSLASMEGSAQESRARNEQLHSKLATLEAELERKTVELNAGEQLIQSLKSDLVSLQASVSKRASEAEGKDHEVSRLTAELGRVGNLTRDTLRLKEELNSVKAQVQTLTRDLDKKGNEIIQKDFELQQVAGMAVELKHVKEELLSKDLLLTAARQEIEALKVRLEAGMDAPQPIDEGDKESPKIVEELKEVKNVLQGKIFELTAREREIKKLRSELEKA